MPSKQLVKPSAPQLPSANLVPRKNVQRDSAGGWIRRLELKSKGKLIDNETLKPGSFCIPIGDDSAIDLGKDIDLMILGYRPKALDMGGSDIIEVFEPEDSVFQDIKKRAAEHNSYCLEGYSFLVFERTLREVVEFFFGSKSLKPFSFQMVNGAPLSIEEIKSEGLEDIEAHGPLTLNLRVKKSPSKRHSYFIPEIAVSADPIELTDAEIEYVSGQINKFVDQKPRKKEYVDAPDGGDR